MNDDKKHCDKNHDELWSAISRIETSVKNSQNDIKKLFLHSTRQEIAIETVGKNLANLQTVVAGIAETTAAGFAENRERFDRQEKRFDQQDKRFDQQDKRFDKIEETLAIIVNHLKK